MRLKESPSQTAGPYIHIGATPNACGIEGVYKEDLGRAMVSAKTLGARITVSGHVFDGTGTPLKDALVEIWQADAAGRYPGRAGADPAFTGWGRQAVDGETGQFRFETIKPGSAPFPDGRPMAPHITFWIVARGINLGLNTRLYFSDEAEANANDAVLNIIEWEARRATLVAKREQGKDGQVVYRFDIHLQGEAETVFFDV